MGSMQAFLADLTIATIVFVAIVPYAKKDLSVLLIELCARSSGQVFGLLSRTSPLVFVPLILRSTTSRH